MGFGSIGGFNPNLNAYGAGKVKKPAEGEPQGDTKAPDLNMVDTKGSETNTNLTLNGLQGLAVYGQALSDIKLPSLPSPAQVQGADVVDIAGEEENDGIASSEDTPSDIYVSGAKTKIIATVVKKAFSAVKWVGKKLTDAFNKWWSSGAVNIGLEVIEDVIEDEEDINNPSVQK